MNILVLNCGSSSLKYQLINMDDESVIAKGLVERIGIEGSVLTHKPTGKDKYVVETPMKDHNIAVKLVLDALQDAEHGVIKSTDEIAAVGHRVLHAGEKYIESCLVTEDVKKVVRECFDLGPLHNPANLIGIEAVEAAMPGKPNVAVWDTAFGMAMPEKAYLYGLPYEYYENYKVRRYGFHGTSHSFVSKETARFLGMDLENSKIIVCHLGNGASISAVKDGKCVDTSMGLTPLEGLVMGTRSGDIDPAIMEYIAKKEDLDIAGVMNVLNKKSGVLATRSFMRGESWSYYKLSGGKTTYFLGKFTNLKTQYNNAKFKTISKSTFNKTLKKYTKGKKAVKRIKTYANTKANRKKYLK